MADKPVDTEGARADLRFANQYFDNWFKQDSPKQKEETFSHVLKYTEQARKKDPSVTLQVKSETGVVKEVTPDSLAAEIHRTHGSYEACNAETSAGRLRGQERLHKSISILSTPVTFAELARAYLFDNDRAKAQEIANAGQQQYPDSFEIRQVLDLLESDEDLGAKPTNPRVILYVIGALLFLGATAALFVADAIRGASPMPRWIFVMAGAGWVLGFLFVIIAIMGRPRGSRR